MSGMAMRAAEARIETARASRYLVQLCRHAQQMGNRHAGIRPHGPRRSDPRMPRDRPEWIDADWSEAAGTLTLAPWGRCTLEAGPDTLILRAEAANEDDLRRIQELLAWNLIRFGRRDQLTVTWRPADATTPGEISTPTSTDPAPRAPAAPRRAPRGRMVLTVTGVLGVMLTVAVHLGLGSGVVAASRWLGWTAFGLVAVPIVIVIGHAAIPATVIGLRRRATRRKQASPEAGSRQESSDPIRPA
jgi:hypothetical protein